MLGIDMGFWIGMGVTTLITIVMIVVFWTLALRKDRKSMEE